MGTQTLEHTLSFHQVKDVRDPGRLGVVLQFVQLLGAGGGAGGGDLAGINQFVSFLSDKAGAGPGAGPGARRLSNGVGRGVERSNSVRSRSGSVRFYNL